MTHEEALKALIEAQEEGDWEKAHGDADDALCMFLRNLGYDDIVDAFDKVGKWYA